MTKMVETTEMTGLLPTLLLVLFIGLKLTEKISWSWWWVLSPAWIPFSIVIIVIIIGLFYSR